MTDDNLDDLSDVELHRKLLLYGFPSLPVTETTRAVLIKKLRNYIKCNKRNELSNSRHSSFSNDREPQDWEIKMRRKAGVASAAKSYRSPTLAESKEAVYKYKPGSNVFYHDDSISYATRRITDHALKSNLTMSPTTLSSTPSSSPKMYTPPPILASDYDDQPQFYSKYPVNVGDRMQNNMYSKSALKPSRDLLQNNKLPTTPRNPHFGVVSRLLSLRDKTLRKEPTSPSLTSTSMLQMLRASNDKTDTAGHQQLKSTQSPYGNWKNVLLLPLTIWRSISHCFRAPTGVQHICIPQALITAFVVFFVVIGFLYMFISTDSQNGLLEHNMQYKICGKDEEKIGGGGRGISELTTATDANCIARNKLATAVAFSKALIQYLLQRTKTRFCSKLDQLPKVGVKEYMQHLQHKSEHMDLQRILTEDLSAVRYLIKQNPQWSIDTENAADHGDQEYLYFVLQKPQVSLMCAFYHKLQTFFLLIGIGALIVVVALAVWSIYRYISERRSARFKAVNGFINEIINELIQRASAAAANADISRAVIVNHLRDKLIPLNKRSAHLSAWQEAVSLLESNDSRIQFGISVENGEEVRTMQWTGRNAATPHLETCNNNSIKQWQSPAFDNFNRITNPPTPCLKIRHMFDASEVNNPNLQQLIEAAIHLKVGTRCKILDIQLDKQTCCVYVRCESEKDAGVMHNDINGWWFDKRLLSIKFLRLQRYLARFPNSTTKTANPAKL